MSDKKVYIGLIGVMILSFTVIFLLFGINSLKNKKNQITLLVGDDTVWEYKDQIWEVKDKFDSYNWKEFDIYLDNEYFGKYQLWHDDKWYAFDSEKNAKQLEGDFLAIKSNIDVDVIKVPEEEIVDQTYVKSVLNEYEIEDSDFTSYYHYSFDFDHDQKAEDFYVVSNVFGLGFESEKYFSFVFMVKNGKIYYLYNELYDNSFDGCKPYFSGFLDINSDQKYEMILSCSKFSTGGVKQSLLQFKNDAFKVLISN